MCGQQKQGVISVDLPVALAGQPVSDLLTATRRRVTTRRGRILASSAFAWAADRFRFAPTDTRSRGCAPHRANDGVDHQSQDLQLLVGDDSP